MNLSALLQSPQSPVVFADPEESPPSVRPDDPARAVMTDLRIGPVSMTTRATPIDTALATMRDAGVRFLFVFDERHALVGSVTAWDIQGEKPVQALQHGSRGRTRADLTVGDVMEPVSDWRVLDIGEVDHLTVAEIMEAMVLAGRRHLVVVERSREPALPMRHQPLTIVRGLFSAARVQMLVGTPLPIEARPSTFAEYERVIGGE